MSSTAKTKRRTGRPSRYSPQLARRICEELAGGKSLRKICAAPDVPSAQVVISWALGYVRDAAEDGFPEQYIRARERRGELYADEIIDLADNASVDPQRSRLQVDARKWVASKLLPKTYGDRVEVEHSGRVTAGVLVVPASVDPEAWSAVAERQQREIEAVRELPPAPVEAAIARDVELAEAEVRRWGVNGDERK